MVNFNTLKSKLSSPKVSSFFKFCNKIYQKVETFSLSGIKKLAKLLVKLKVSANAVTFFGFFVGLLAINFLAIESYAWALVCILINRFCDILDGAVAKEGKVTVFGIFLDATLDYMFYAGVIFGFALANSGQNAVAATFLLFGLMSSACSLLAYAIIAYQNKIDTTAQISDSPFYLGGFAQGFETFVALVILCIFPYLFTPIAIILGIFCFIKAVSIVTSAYYGFVIAGKKKKNQ